MLLGSLSDRRAKMRRTIIGIGVAGILAALLMTSLMAEQTGATSDRGLAANSGRTLSPAETQRRLDEIRRDTFGASVEQWKIIGPLVDKVVTLDADANRYRSPRPRDPNIGLTAIQKARAALSATLNAQPAATEEEIQKSIDALHQAVAATRKELAATQAELRKHITLKQEAMFVTRWLLD
jgi:hypothetical protein